jgi:hypothetical protein
MIDKINEKWGFGMAPEKKITTEKRISSVRLVIDLIDSSQISNNTPDALSEVKGMFMRIVRQDQWDWFIAFENLGRPSKLICKKIGNQLKILRDVITKKSSSNIDEEIFEILNMNIKYYLNVYLRNDSVKLDTPQIYILSTREEPAILKIGFTTRSVLERVNEINSSTGVLIPYGVRAAWRVKNAKKIEREIHDLLDDFRIRSDREFFKIGFEKAFSIINKFLREKRLESNE